MYTELGKEVLLVEPDVNCDERLHLQQQNVDDGEAQLVQHTVNVVAQVLLAQQEQ